MCTEYTIFFFFLESGNIIFFWPVLKQGSQKNYSESRSNREDGSHHETLSNLSCQKSPSLTRVHIDILPPHTQLKEANHLTWKLCFHLFEGIPQRKLRGN